MSSINISVEGFDELIAKIKQLIDQDKKSEVLMILRQVAKPTLDAAKTIVPVSRKQHVISGSRQKKTIQPGNLKRSLGYITGRKGNSAVNPTVYVGPRAKNPFDGWYGHFVHDGVNIYRKGYRRRHIGGGVNNHAAMSRTKAQPFMATAFSMTENTATADAEKRMEKFIQRRIDRLS